MPHALPPAPPGRAPTAARRYRLPTLVLTGLFTAGTLTGAGSAGATAPLAAPAAPAAAPQAFTLTNTSPTTTARRTEGNPAYLYSEGLALVAGSKPVVFTATRSTYAKPVVTTFAVGNVKRTLPAALAGLSGLKQVFTVSVKNAAGAAVGRPVTVGACPTVSGQGGRTRPDAPDTSPYPAYCSAGPFALRTVFGVPAGWAAPVGSGAVIDGPDGVYTVTTSVTPAWRTLFGIPASKATTTTKVTVVTVEEDEEFQGPGAAGHAHGHAAAPDTTVSPTAVSHTAWLASPEGRAATPVQRMRHAEAAHAARVAGIEAATRAGAGSTAAVATGSSGIRRVAAPAVPVALRPDLRSLPAYGIGIAKGSEFGDGFGEEVDPALRNHEFLTFGATTWNAGAGPLVVEGFRRPGSAVMDAYEYFYSKGKQVSYAKVGTMEYDPKKGHEHWHFKDFAQYNLLDGRQRQKLRSGKESWCLAPTDAVDLLQPGAVANPDSTGLGSACGSSEARTIREVLPSGWGDTYGQYLPGQSFDITGLPNGTYYIEVVANPDKRLIEASTTNNRSLRKIVLSGAPGSRQVAVPPYQGVDTEGDRFE